MSPIPQIDFDKPPQVPDIDFTQPAPVTPPPAATPVPPLAVAPLRGRQRQPIADLVTKYATQHGIPTEIAHRVVRQESGGNVRAVSPVGARGVMQLMPGTAKALGVRDAFDPEQNIEAGMRYLRQKYNEFGSWDKALAAYNAGSGAVRKHGGVPPYRETQNYVRNILGGAGRGISKLYQRAMQVPAPKPVVKAVEAAAAPGEATERVLTGGLGFGGLTRAALRPLGEGIAETLGHEWSPLVQIPRMFYDPINLGLAGVGGAITRLRPRPPAIATQIRRGVAVPAVEMAPSARGLSEAVAPEFAEAPPPAASAQPPLRVRRAGGLRQPEPPPLAAPAPAPAPPAAPVPGPRGFADVVPPEMAPAPPARVPKAPKAPKVKIPVVKPTETVGMTDEELNAARAVAGQSKRNLNTIAKEAKRRVDAGISRWEGDRLVSTRAPEAPLPERGAGGEISDWAPDVIRGLQTNQRTPIGSIRPAAEARPYGLSVRRERDGWVLMANTPQSSQDLGRFSKAETLFRAAEKLVRDHPTFEGLRDLRAKRSSAARGGQWERQEREHAEGLAKYYQQQEEAEAAQRGLAAAVPPEVLEDIPRTPTELGGQQLTTGMELGPRRLERLVGQESDLPTPVTPPAGEQTGLAGVITPRPQERAAVSPMTAASRQNMEEIASGLAEEAQRGAVRLGGGPAAPPPAGVTPGVQRMLAMGRPGVRERLGEALTRTNERLRNYFVPEGAILDVRTAPGHTPQEFRDDFRLFRDVPRSDVPEMVTRDIVGVIAPLERAEYDAFQNYIVMRDLAEEYRVAAARGRRPSIPLGIPEEEVNQNLRAFDQALTPKARAAVGRHDRITAAQRDEYIRRGWGDAEDFREFHFRHFTMDYDEIFGSAVGIPRGRLTQPRRAELKGRTGSQRPILTDYIEVRQKQLSKFYLDNAVDDFMADIQPKVDWLPHLSKDERIALFGPKGRPNRAGQLVTLDDGTRLMTWQYVPGNRLFPTYSLDAKILEGVTQKTLTTEELAALLEAVAHPETKKAARQVLALGQKHPMILVDPAVAERLQKFNVGKDRAELFEAVSAYSGIWKRAIVDSLGLPFQFRNLLGDMENGMVIGGGAVRTPFGKAATILVKDAFGGRLTPQEQRLLDLAKRYRVVQSGLVSGTLKSAVAADPRLQHLLPRGEQLARLPGRALGVYEKGARIREEATRLAHFMDNMERIQRGQTIRTGAIDVTGLVPKRAAAKVAREAFVDYGWKTPFEEQFGRGALAPFVSWYYQNTKNWTKMAARRPMALAAKTVPLYGAMALWNNTGERAEIEKNLPPWQRMMPHIITGWRLPDGRPLIVGFQGGSASAAQAYGLTRVFEAANQVRSGEFTTEEAVARLPGDMIQEIARGAAFQIGPIITVPAETAMFAASRGRTAMDIRRGQERIPERLQGTAAGARKFLSEEAQAAIPPFGIAMRQQQIARVTPPGTPISQRAAMATGIVRPVDLAGEQRRRMIETIGREKAAREDKLFAVEQAYIRTGNPQQAVEEAKRQNERAGPKLTGREINTRLTSTRIQIERVREQIRVNQDPAQAAVLRRLLDRLMAQDAMERTQRAPRSVRPLVVPDLQRQRNVPEINFEEPPQVRP